MGDRGLGFKVCFYDFFFGTCSYGGVEGVLSYPIWRGIGEEVEER